MRRYFLSLLLAVPAMLYASGATADFFESLVMPGPVIDGHAEYEQECERCHEPFSKTSQSQLCVACHKNVASDIKARTGFHGRRAEVAQADCKHCHTDHEGRDADVVRLDPDTFDHDFTDFPLRGVHRRTACADCHMPKSPYHEAPGTCTSCHEEDDAHEGQLGKACADCHTETSWREAKFDHGGTDFPLLGAHRDVACAACHAGQRYEATPTTCAACHQLQDVHGGRYGERCQTCHSIDKWRNARFDHKRETSFALIGKHAQVTCDACHTGPLYGQKVATDCLSCHRNDDEHKGRNGDKCEACHSPVKWSAVKFDHDTGTTFPLRGKHSGLSCKTCHRGSITREKLDTSCAACHGPDDPHGGQQGQDCGQCHGEENWSSNVSFDHELTRFPLIGLHAAAPCEECHVTQKFKDADPACRSCHEQDDYHEGRLGPDCGRCHNPNSWTLWQFDHDGQTDYPLTGAHKGLDCHACHTEQQAQRVSRSTACLSCHRKDDIHRGRFGNACERCHTTDNFETRLKVR